MVNELSLSKSLIIILAIRDNADFATTLIPLLSQQWLDILVTLPEQNFINLERGVEIHNKVQEERTWLRNQE